MTAKFILPSLLLCAAAFEASAQFDQSINVDGKYIPDVIHQERVGSFPRPIYFPMNAGQLQYSLSGVSADFTPQAIPIPASAWNADRPARDSHGYLDLGLGSWLNSTMSAGYRFVDNQKSAFGAAFQHNSTSLWRPTLSDVMDASRRFRYDESLSLYGHHLFGNAGRLEASLSYHFGAFNYYGYDPSARLFDSEMNGVKAPHQTLHDVAARAAWASVASDALLTYNAELGYRYFGYRRLWVPSQPQQSATPDSDLDALTGGRESHLNLKGGIQYASSESSAFGLNLAADFLSYSDYDYKGAAPALAAASIEAPDSYSTLSLTPYYRLLRNRFSLQAGIVFDMAFHAGPSDSRYDLLHVAPDVRIGFDAGATRLYLNLLGGTRLHTLSGGYDLDYYQQPAIFNSTPTHTPLDAAFGASFGPFSGFEAGAELAFRTSRTQYLGGLYQAWLNYDSSTLPGLPYSVDSHPMQYTYIESAANLTGWKVGAHLSYDAGKMIAVRAAASYQPQNGTHGYFNGYDRPRWLISASAESNPWSSLRLRLAYEYRGIRAQPVWGFPLDSNPLQAMLDADVRMLRLPDITMLNFGASYSFSPKFNVWIQADNLLGRHTPRFFGLPEEGLRLYAGIGWRF